MRTGPAPWTVLGVGHPARGDDEFGLSVLTRLAHRPELLGVAAFHACSPTLFGILEAWQGRANVVTIGAARAGTENHGHIYRCEYVTDVEGGRDGLPEAMRRTEALGLAVELGAALGVLPRRLIVYAAHGCAFQTGAGLSRPVSAAVPPLVARICRDILAPDPPPAPPEHAAAAADPEPEAFTGPPRPREAPCRPPRAMRRPGADRGPAGPAGGSRDA